MLANRGNDKNEELVSIAGKCCESGDMLIWDINLPQVASADLLAISCTGAYVAQADVALDFSSAAAAAAHLAACRAAGGGRCCWAPPGWTPPSVRSWTPRRGDIALLVAPNTSLAVALLTEELAERAARALGEYDADVLEAAPPQQARRALRDRAGAGAGAAARTRERRRDPHREPACQGTSWASTPCC